MRQLSDNIHKKEEQRNNEAGGTGSSGAAGPRHEDPADRSRNREYESPSSRTFRSISSQRMLTNARNDTDGDGFNRPPRLPPITTLNTDESRLVPAGQRQISRGRGISRWREEIWMQDNFSNTCAQEIFQVMTEGSIWYREQAEALCEATVDATHRYVEEAKFEITQEAAQKTQEIIESMIAQYADPSRQLVEYCQHKCSNEIWLWNHAIKFKN